MRRTEARLSFNEPAFQGAPAHDVDKDAANDDLPHRYAKKQEDGRVIITEMPDGGHDDEGDRRCAENHVRQHLDQRADLSFHGSDHEVRN